ncbi:MAG: hypothetical protein QOH62_1498 [Solirubrobacteraceae bacterium]|nr:hypothetical protein [Solirubrobacteraceae bacterium]
MKAKIAALAAVVASVLVAPAGASAAAITPDQQCYPESQEGAVTIAGSGFTPNATASLTGGPISVTTPTDATGSFTTTFAAPATTLKHPGAQTMTLTGTDDATGQAVATTQINIAKRGVDGVPARSRPHKRITWNLAGFVGGGAVYGHWRFKGKTRANHRMGVPAGPCGVLKTKARQIEASTLRFGRWTVQFDFNKTFKSTATPRASVAITVFRTFK